MDRRTAVRLLGTFALVGTRITNLWAQEKKEEKKEAPAAPPLALKVGDTAPDFTLRDQTFQHQISLHDYKGKKNVALAFYIFAFTGG